MPGTHPKSPLMVAVLTAALAICCPPGSGAPAPVFDLGVEAPIQASPEIDEIGIEPGGTGVLPITLDLPATHHLNSQPRPRFSVKEPPGLAAGAVELRGDRHLDELLEVEVYSGTVTLLVELRAEDVPLGVHTLRGELTYYPCSDADLTCFEKTDKIELSVRIERGASAVSPPEGAGAEDLSSPLEGGRTFADRVSDSFGESLLLAYVLVFFGGILASFTPCVYPMIPITVAVIGAGSAGSKSRGFKLSTIYVLGIAVTYSILGAAAAGTGKAFGSFTQTFPVLLGIGLLLGALGAGMFGFFEMQPPAFLRNLQSKRGRGHVGILLMGAVTGLVASPCLGPVLIALLAWIAKTGDVFRGFTLLFVFALGMGLLLIAIGTFSSVLTALPKSGNWMLRVKELLGLILVGVGVYYVGLALATRGVPERATWTVALGVALAVLGYIVRGHEKSAAGGEGPAPPRGLKGHLRKGVGVVLVVAGAYLTILGLSAAGLAPSWTATTPPETTSQNIEWAPSYETAMERAEQENVPVVIDFYADWCVYCKKLDSDVFSDERVIDEAGRFVMVRVDADRREDVVGEHEVLGLPTVVFLDSAGAEATRIESYVKAEEFLSHMKSVR